MGARARLVRCLEPARHRRHHGALRRQRGIQFAHHRPPLGQADGWIRGKLRLRANFEVGVKAPNLRFDLIDVLLGVGVICIIYRRETGTLVSDIVELNAEGLGSRVLSCYSRVRK